MQTMRLCAHLPSLSWLSRGKEIKLSSKHNEQEQTVRRPRVAINMHDMLESTQKPCIILLVLPGRSVALAVETLRPTLWEHLASQKFACDAIPSPCCYHKQNPATRPSPNPHPHNLIYRPHTLICYIQTLQGMPCPMPPRHAIIQYHSFLSLPVCLPLLLPFPPFHMLPTHCHLDQ